MEKKWERSAKVNSDRLVFSGGYVYPTPHNYPISDNCIIPTATPNKMQHSCHIDTIIGFVRHGCLTKLKIVYKHQSPNVIRFEIVPLEVFIAYSCCSTSLHGYNQILNRALCWVHECFFCSHTVGTWLVL
jgi:hypothetical protein